MLIRPFPESPFATALTGALTLAVAMGIGRFAFTPLLPMMQADSDVSLAAGSWLASANYFGYLAGALLAPLLRWSPGSIIRFALASVVAVTLAMGWLDQFAAWMALRAAAGVMSAWLLIFTSEWCLRKMATQNHSHLGGVLFAGVGAGIALAGAACLALMLAGVGSAAAWLTLGTFAFLLTVLLWPAFAGTAATPKSDKRHRQGFTADQWRLILGNAANGFGYIVPATFLPAMAKETLSDPAMFGWAWPIFGLAALTSTLAAGAALRFIGNRRLWAASHFVMATGAVLPVFIQGLAAIMFSALAVGGTFMIATMCAIREARIVAASAPTRLIAAVTAAFALGQIAGPLCVAALAGQTDPYMPALLAAALLLVASGIALAGVSISKPRGETR